MLEVDFWNDPRYARFRDDIIVVSAKDVVNESGNEIDLSTIEVKIDSLSQGKKTVFIDLRQVGRFFHRSQSSRRSEIRSRERRNIRHVR